MIYVERKRHNGDYEIIIQIEKEDFQKMKISSNDKRFFRMSAESNRLSDKIGALHKLSMIFEQATGDHLDICITNNEHRGRE